MMTIYKICSHAERTNVASSLDEGRTTARLARIYVE